MSDLTFPPAIQAMFDNPAYWMSNRQHRALCDDLDRRFRSALAGAIECEPHLTGRFLDQSGAMAQLPWLAWDDDPRGGYWIGSGIVHEWDAGRGTDADDWPTFLWANYLRDSEDGEAHEIEDYRAFHMTEHVCRDVHQLVEVTLRGLRDHRAFRGIGGVGGADQ